LFLQFSWSSLLFQSPEVAKCERYGYPADAYSYAMFLYECVSLTKPLIEMIRADDPKHFERKVVHENYRPNLKSSEIFTEKLQALLETSWDKDPSVRPTMEGIARQLQECIAEIAKTLREKSWFPSMSFSTTSEKAPSSFRRKTPKAPKPAGAGEDRVLKDASGTESKSPRTLLRASAFRF
jgi:Protein tyrosine and serine/threonine kinase